MSFSRSKAAVAFLCVFGGGAPGVGEATAWGNAAARAFSAPEAASGPFSSRPTPIEVEREELAIRCDEVEGAPHCRVEATYHLHNPAPTTEEATGVFYGSRQGDLSIQLDGADARAVLVPEEIASLDAAVRAAAGRAWDLLLDRDDDGRAHLPESRIGPMARMPVRTGFRVRLAAGARGSLVFAGPLDATYRDNPNAHGGLAIPAYQARHAALASNDQRDASYSYQYLLAPLWTWGGARVAIAVEFDVPRRWRFSPPELAPSAMRQVWSTTTTGGRTVARVVLAGDATGAPGLPFSFVVPRRPLLNGGPLVGVGGAFGDAHGLRLRVGYEVARPSWMVYSLALETNARDRVSGALVAEAASPCLAFIIPSLGLGLGPVVEHRPGQTATGARVQTTLGWLLVSAVLHVDVFPGETDPARWGLLGQVSF